MQLKSFYNVIKKMSNDIDPTTEVLGVNIFEEYVDFVIDEDRTIRYKVYSDDITNTKLEYFE